MVKTRNKMHERGFLDPRWSIDHPREPQKGEDVYAIHTKRDAYISEPYNIGKEQLKKLIEVSDEYGIDFIIDGASIWNPGHCFRIIFFTEEEEAEDEDED